MKLIKPTEHLRGQELLGLKFRTPLINGGGTCKTIRDVEKLIKTDLGGIEIGSITYEERAGNTGTTFNCTDYCSINSIGMNNMGIMRATKELPIMIQMIHDAGKVGKCCRIQSYGICRTYYHGIQGRCRPRNP